METLTFEAQIAEASRLVCEAHPDPSHDFAHILRVVKIARKIAASENARVEIVVPAAYLHDFEHVAKTDARRSRASALSAEKAVGFLRGIGYPEEFLDGIAHAIEVHSYSANLAPRTLEAGVVQDADRLDAIGSIGIARCFGLSGLIRRDFYRLEDPFCDARMPDDQSNSLDHFFVKLLKIPDLLNTTAALEEAGPRIETMKNFLAQLRREI